MMTAGMRLFRSREQREARASASSAYQEQLERLDASNLPATRAAIHGLQQAADGEVFSEREVTKMNASAFVRYAESALADDHLTSEEEDTFNELIAALGLSVQELASEHPDIWTRIVIARINDGRLWALPEGDAQLIPKAGEHVLNESYAALMKEVVEREFRGGSRGVSIPIAKGVRFRTGSFRGHSVVVGVHLVEEDEGVLSVTTQRAVFIGNRKTIDMPYSKIVGMELFSDGIRFNVSNRQRAPLFKADNVEVLAATINKVMDRDYTVLTD
jgi:hypothetical protein